MAPRFPFDPFPIGWYATVRTSALAARQVEAFTLCGRELVLWRTASGRVAVADAWCPHLGAHLARGGKVDGEVLVCPFHAFRFDPDGACVGTPYGSEPPHRCRLTTWHAVERAGAVLVWWHPNGEAPTWQIPDHIGEWPVPKLHAWTLRSHPQETNENVADIGHLAVVHGYRNLREIEGFRSEGPVFRARYGMDRPTRILGVTLGQVGAEFTANGYGLGYSYVETRVPDMRVTFRNFVLATPTDGEHIQLMVGVTGRFDAADGASTARRAAALAAIRPVLQIAHRTFIGDVAQDLAIWENKIYVHPPILARGDGPVGKFRAWCRQFYPNSVAA